MNPYKERFAPTPTARTLTDALVGADVFFGLSQGNCVTPDMVAGHGPEARSSSRWPIPIRRSRTMWRRAARPDAIVATGRSDYPNQVNNVLGFPFIFRGALDVRATTINDEMKLAATRALAALAKEDVPDSVRRAYGARAARVRARVPDPEAVRSARAGLGGVGRGAGGHARRASRSMPIDLAEYREQLERRLGKAHEVMRVMINKAQRQPKRVVFPEGEEDKILRACQILVDEKIATAHSAGRRSRDSRAHGGSASARRVASGLSIRQVARIARGTSKSFTCCGSAKA